MKLTEQKCEACEGGVIPLNMTEAEILLKQIPGWEVATDAKSISRDFTFKNFVAIIKFTNKVSKLAESEGHHPDAHITNYRHLKLVLSTHAIDGLSNNDFILAAKINELS